MPLLPDRASLCAIANAFRFVGMFMAIMGLIVLGGYAIWYGTALRTTAEIVGTVRDRAGNEEVVVRYTDKSGKEHDVEVSFRGRNASPGSNQRLGILYHQENPERVVVDGFFEKWFLGGFLVVWGSLLWWVLSIAAKWLSRTNNEANNSDHSTVGNVLL
jgi:hypothetical protein